MATRNQILGCSAMKAKGKRPKSNTKKKATLQYLIEKPCHLRWPSKQKGHKTHLDHSDFNI